MVVLGDLFEQRSEFEAVKHPDILYSLLFISGAILIVRAFDCWLQYIVDIHFHRYLNIYKLLKTIGILKKAKFLWTGKNFFSFPFSFV